MRVHANPINLINQADALYAAQKAAANRESERTRKKLLGFGSGSEADAGESCVVSLGADKESQEQAKGQNQQDQGGHRKRQEERADAADTDNSVEDWA